MPPTSSDDVAINSGPPDVTSADANARSITEGTSGSLTIEAGRTLTVSNNGSSVIAGQMTLRGTLTPGDATTWSVGQISLLDNATVNVTRRARSQLPSR